MLQELWNSAKVKLRYMLLLQNCSGVSFSLSPGLFQESDKRKLCPPFSLGKFGTEIYWSTEGLSGSP